MNTEHAGRIKRLLITGVSGRIGTATANFVTEAGIAVTGLSLTKPAHEYCDRFYQGDAASPDLVRNALFDVDAIIHLAAIPHPTGGSPYDVYCTNVNSTFNVLCLAGEQNISRVVIASSINACGIPFNAHRVMPAYYPIDEQLPADIEDAYSLSKATGELAAQMANRRWGTTIVSLRFPLVQSRSMLIATSAEAVANPTGSVREGWSYLDVRDAARAIWQSTIHPLAGAHAFNLSAADTLIDAPTASILARYAPGVPIRRALFGRESAVDNSLIQRVLGFKPRYSIFSDDASHDHANTRPERSPC